MTYYNANVGPTGANQPLSFNPQAVASSTGGATFNFPAVPNGQIWTGTVTVIGAPDSATMTISSIHLGNDIGQFIGGNNWGPLQLQSGDQLIVTASGLISGTTYVCNFQGTGITGGDPGITYPEAYAHSVTTRTEDLFLTSGQQAISSGTVLTSISLGSQPVNPAYRSFTVITWLSNASSSFSLTTVSSFKVNAYGQTSSLQYNPYQSTSLGYGISLVVQEPPYVFQNYEYKFAVFPGLDTTMVFNVTFSATSVPSGSYFNWVIVADLTPLDIAVYGPVTAISANTSNQSGTTASSLIAVKTSAGTLYGIYLFNNSTTANTYLQIWNLATGNITIGTTAPLYSFGVPFGGGAYIPFPEPLAFSTAITIAATTTRAGSTYATTGLDYDIIYV